MKKIISTVLLSALLSVSAICAEFPTDYFVLGKNAFNKKDYTSANKYFVQYLTQNPNDANGRYYYAQTLTYLKNYKQARLEYGYVMQLAPNTMVANYAKTCLQNLDKVDKTTTGNTATTTTASQEDNVEQDDFTKLDNYLPKTISSEGEINTWNLDKMPLKVFFDMSKTPKSQYVSAFKNAFSAWQAVSDGMISFQYVTAKDNADVVVLILGAPPKADSFVLGHTNTLYSEGFINSATITMYSMDSKYNSLSVKDFYNVSLHEIGHMLGIEGHSDNTNDIMFPSYDKAGASATMHALSERDINTFKAIYSLDKNPYATGVNSLNKVLGSKATRLNLKLQDDLAYVQKFPNAPTSYNSVAHTYEMQNKDAEAIEYYQKALSIDPMNAYANGGLARMYGRRNDLKNAEIYYKNLIRINSKDIAAYCNLTNLYIKNGKMQLAKSTMANLVYRNPSAKNDATVKAIQKQLSAK